MWAMEHRGRYDRSKQRYPSDLTDAEWKLVDPLIPPGKRGGGRRKVIVREVVNGLMYVLNTGCQWAAIPRTFCPKAPCTIISISGAGTTRPTPFTRCST